jgi:hypothetical protein
MSLNAVPDAASAAAATREANAAPPIATAALRSLPLPELAAEDDEDDDEDGDDDDEEEGDEEEEDDDEEAEEAGEEEDEAVGAALLTMALISAADCASVPTLSALDRFEAPPPIMSIDAVKSCARMSEMSRQDNVSGSRCRDTDFAFFLENRPE